VIRLLTWRSTSARAAASWDAEEPTDINLGPESTQT
jgi:hypothetical protein